MRKKILSIVIIIIACMTLSLLIAAKFINDNIARKTADKLASFPLPDNTEYMESVYKAGKLVGNGNGMQYFGAILIKSEFSLGELKKYYSNYAEKEWECIIENQIGTDIKIIEHTQLSFRTDIDGNNYYIVYSWGYNNTIFRELDIRGH